MAEREVIVLIRKEFNEWLEEQGSLSSGTIRRKLVQLIQKYYNYDEVYKERFNKYIISLESIYCSCRYVFDEIGI